MNLEEIIGVHQWQSITIGSEYFCVPDLNWCAKFIILALSIYFLIKGILRVTQLVAR